MAKKVWGQESTSGQSGIGYLKWQDGVTTIRLVGDGDEHYVHWCPDMEGKPMKVICPGKNCPVCQELNRQREEAVNYIKREDSEFFDSLERERLTKQAVSDRVKELKGKNDGKSRSLIDIYECLLNVYYNQVARKAIVAYVIDRSDNEIKIADLKKTVIDAIDNLAKDPDYGTPEKYDIKVTKSGKGMFGIRYTVMPGKQTPLTEDEKTKIESLPDISTLHKSHNTDDIMGMGLAILHKEEIPV